MQNTLPYELSKMDEHVTVVSEQQEPYVDLFNAAVDEFNAKLRYIDNLCADPKVGSDELSILTTRTILDMSYVCADFERTLAHDKAAIEDAKNTLRERTNLLISKSHFMNHARTWPRGYQGDYLLLEGVYRNIPLSQGIGYYLDRHSLSTTLSIAVRERLATLQDLLAVQFRRRDELRVLNVACGSCREVFDLAQEIKTTRASITCVDFDIEALSFASNRLAHAGIPPEQLMFLKYNAFRMINHERNLKEFGMQDVIYSAGFFDYVADHVLISLLRAAYKLLNPGGTLIAPFKDGRRYRTQEYHWFIKWDGFLQRTEEGMWTLFEKADIPFSAIKTRRDRSEVILFFEVTKE
jgi:extracellular factor (EF) 3-hydroxypalmitic acid methyl ester biosynthesis protein